MKIDYNIKRKYVFYETEMRRALDWLYEIRDEEEKGWAWVQFIKPNEQNTAEVIYAFAENEKWLAENEEKIPKLIESISKWLLDTSYAVISIDFCWVALSLQKIRQCPRLYDLLDKERLDKAVRECLKWLLDNKCINKIKDKDSNKSSEKGWGWGDNDKEISNEIRTSLAVMCLQNEVLYSRENKIDNPDLPQYEEAVEKALEWLVSAQNSDGGWGNIDERLITQEYQRTHSFSYSDLRYQCGSNAASTGYVMLALNCCDRTKYEGLLCKAHRYLTESQMDNGGWEVFTEIGMRDGTKYTFRHFGTTWALKGLILCKVADYTNEEVIHGFEYLSMLQDEIYGGWKSSPDADNYTWATCNALSTINTLKESLSDIHAKHFLSIVWDWWILKKRETSFSFTIGKCVFAFNAPMALAFCIVFSIMQSLILYFIINLSSSFMGNMNEDVVRLIYSLITVFAAVILGLPWIVYVKNRFRSEVSGWIDSIGWVYGIITGFVLVLYQFIL